MKICVTTRLSEMKEAGFGGWSSTGASKGEAGCALLQTQRLFDELSTLHHVRQGQGEVNEAPVRYQPPHPPTHTRWSLD